MMLNKDEYDIIQIASYIHMILYVNGNFGLVRLPASHDDMILYDIISSFPTHTSCRAADIFSTSTLSGARSIRVLRKEEGSGKVRQSRDRHQCFSFQLRAAASIQLL